MGSISFLESHLNFDAPTISLIFKDQIFWEGHKIWKKIILTLQWFFNLSNKESTKVSSSYHLCVECFSQLSFDSEVYTKLATAADFVYTWIGELDNSWFRFLMSRTGYWSLTKNLSNFDSPLKKFRNRTDVTVDNCCTCSLLKMDTNAMKTTVHHPHIIVSF